MIKILRKWNISFSFFLFKIIFKLETKKIIIIFLFIKVY